MTRNRASAKQAGARFNRQIADGLLEALGDDNIDKAALHGAADIGDIANVRHPNGGRIAIECKDYGGRLQPAQWVREAQAEADNYGAIAGLTIAKRRGTTKFHDQWVIMTVADLLKLLNPEK